MVRAGWLGGIFGFGMVVYVIIMGCVGHAVACVWARHSFGSGIETLPISVMTVLR